MEDADDTPGRSVANKYFIEGFQLVSSQIILPLEWEPPIFPVKQMWTGETNVFCTLMDSGQGDWLTTAAEKSRLRRQIYRYIAANSNYEKSVEEVLVQLLLLYQQVKAEQRPEVRNISRNVLGMAAHICEKYRPKKGEFIQYVMGEYVSNGNNILDWFEFINPIGGLDVLSRSMLYPLKLMPIGNPVTDDWISQKHIDALEYYLTHGNSLTFVATAKALFLNDSDTDHPLIEEHMFDCVTPLVDFPSYYPLFGVVTPLSLACMTANIKCVLLLLRHGALPTHNYSIQKNPYRNWETPLFVLGNQLTKRGEYVFPRADLPAAHDNHLRQFHIHRCSKIVKCIRLMLRAQPFLPLRFEGQICGKEGEPPRDAPTDIMCVDERLLELIPPCLTDPVPDLQRQCRWAIRRKLRVHRALPTGINHLPLPKMIKLFLDLQAD